MAIGIIEFKNLIYAIASADVMLKSCEIKIIGKEIIPENGISIFVEGDLQSVKSAIESAQNFLQKFGQNLVHQIINKPENDILFLMNQNPVYAAKSFKSNKFKKDSDQKSLFDQNDFEEEQNIFPEEKNFLKEEKLISKNEFSENKISSEKIENKIPEKKIKSAKPEMKIQEEKFEKVENVQITKNDIPENVSEITSIKIDSEKISDENISEEINLNENENLTSEDFGNYDTENSDEENFEENISEEKIDEEISENIKSDFAVDNADIKSETENEPSEKSIDEIQSLDTFEYVQTSEKENLEEENFDDEKFETEIPNEITSSENIENEISGNENFSFENINLSELEKMNVQALRKFARGIENFPIKGRQISMANKQILLEYFAKLI